MRLRLLVAAVSLAGSGLAPGVPASATPVPPGFASPNVEWLANVPVHADTAGARIHGNRLYLTSSHELTIYDISNPELPVLMSTLPLPQEPYLAEEDVDTNGKILLIGTLRRLIVVDVRDGTRPTILSMLEGGDEHTVTCVLDCTWAYGSYGGIYDLRDPARPKRAGEWDDASSQQSGHDVTEVSPGLLVTSTWPIRLLDARRDPARPRVLATGTPPDGRFIHAALWPNRATDRWLLVGGESTGGRCTSEQAGAFMTWDTANWARTKKFRLVDEYRPSATTPTEGGFPVGTFCSHWFTTRPGYRNGGIVAAGWYESGTRFLRVTKTGQIDETGWFLPAGTSVSAAYWVTKDIVYLLDYNRGLDIVKFHDRPVRRAAATSVPPGMLGPDEAPAARVRFVPRVDAGGRMWCPVPARVTPNEKR